MACDWLHHDTIQTPAEQHERLAARRSQQIAHVPKLNGSRFLALVVRGRLFNQHEGRFYVRKEPESFSLFVVWNIPREDILARHCGVPFFQPFSRPEWIFGLSLF